MTVPFLVADRPASLRIIRNLRIPQERRLGLMSHANTSETFKRLFRDFPCGNTTYCEVPRGRCPSRSSQSSCDEGLILRKKITKMADSGVFSKKGCLFPSYSDLFREYERMGVGYGIIIDHLKDKNRTHESAARAIEVHRSQDRSFELVGVAQGVTLDDYVESYRVLLGMGYRHIAIGGLLKKGLNSARYVQVRDENLLWSVLKRIRQIDPKGWLFALGCYAPSRHRKLLELGVYGSDYKGWIFQYRIPSTKTVRGDIAARRSRFRQVRSFINDEILSNEQQPRGARNLLIISCSKAKRNFSEEVPAIQLYDGPFYRLLRKYIQEHRIADDIDIRILSAKYGLHDSRRPIESYNLKMDSTRALELKDDVLDSLSLLFAGGKTYSRILVNLGRDYLRAMDGFESVIPAENLKGLEVVEGRIGERTKSLKMWLEALVLDSAEDVNTNVALRSDS